MKRRVFMLASMSLLVLVLSAGAQPGTDLGVLKVVSPNGGETYVNGTTQNISWRYNGIDKPVAITIQMSQDMGKTYAPISGELLGTATQFNWMVRVTDSKSNLIKVEARLPQGNPLLPAFRSVSDVSDAPFSVVTKVEIPTTPSIQKLVVLSPKAGDVWLKGTTHEIVWQRLEGMAAPKFYNVMLTTDEWKGNTVVIAKEIPGAMSSFKWTVNAPTTKTARVKVIAYYPDTSIEGLSNGQFAVMAASPTTSIAK